MKKIIKILIIIVIPLLAGFGISCYAYGRYKNGFFEYYMKQTEDQTTIERFVSLMEYQEQYLDKDGFDFYYSDDLKNSKGNIFHIDIIRACQKTKENVTDKNGVVTGTKDLYTLTYYVVVYNINYETLAKTLDDTNDPAHRLLENQIPKFSMKIQSKEDEDKSTSKSFNTTGATFAYADIRDDNYMPKKDSKGNKMAGESGLPMYYAVIYGTDLNNLGDDKVLIFNADSNWDNSEQVSEELTRIEFSDLYSANDVEKKDEVKAELDTFKKVYNKNDSDAGYFGYCFRNYMWWEALIAIVVVGFVCGAFVVVWSSEEKDKKAKIAKK